MMLTWFDTELRDLDEVSKATATDAELVIEELEHDIQSLAKE